MTRTDERCESLKVMWADGLSCSRIAAALGGITRNSVIGKVCRLGLARRGVGNPNSGRPRKLSIADSPPKRKYQRAEWSIPGLLGDRRGNNVFREIEQPSSPDDARRAFGKPVTIFELTPNTCRWPIGESNDPQLKFCGARPAYGCPYCAPHKAVAYQKPLRVSANQRQAIETLKAVAGVGEAA